MTKTRKLSNELNVSALGLGCMDLSVAYGVTDKTESIATIHRALELGVNFLDPADVDEGGANESLVRRAIGDRRDQVIIATKFGIAGFTLTEPELLMQTVNRSARYT